MRKTLTLIVSTVAAALGVAACGGSAAHTSKAPGRAGGTSAASSAPASNSSGPATPASHVVSLSTNSSGQLMFSTTTLHALAGKVTIHFTNKAPEGHNFSLQQGAGGKVIAATPTFTGGTKTLVVHLQPGTYTYFCSVPGHRQSGMQGTLKVT